MFGRSSDRSSNEDQRRSSVQPITPPTGTREAAAVPISPLAGAGASAVGGSDQSVVAADDRIEGKLRTSKGLRILGTVDGSIESASFVYIEEGARVSADVSAEEVVIGGQYSGKLTCRQRLEVRPTGRVSGSIETVKLMLHEGGFVDGELHMQKPADQNGDARAKSDAGGRPTEREARPVGSVRSTVEPSIRQPAAAGGGNGGASPTG